MSQHGRFDMARLGKIHSDRMFSVIEMLSEAGKDGMSITDVCRYVYGDEPAQMCQCRHLWETAINDLGVIGMCKDHVVKGVFHYYLTLEGKVFLQENSSEG